MAPETLLALVVFAGLGAGVWLLALAVRGLPPAPSGSRMRPRLRSLAEGPTARRAGTAAADAVAVAVLTRWPVAALAAGALTYAWPRLFGGGRDAQAAIDRLEALATWTESLKDTIAGAVGLEEAIPATLPAASPQIQPQLLRLVGRLRAREPLPAALGRFAADLDDPSADLVVAALILNARLRGGGLRATLQALATSAREELDMRRRVEAGRRAIRKGVRIVVGVTLGFVAALAALNSAYLAPYDTALGQLVLVVVIAVFGAGFAWLRALSDVDMPQRFLHRPDPHTSGREVAT
jgi:Flp pilus assembly protein TadB